MFEIFKQMVLMELLSKDFEYYVILKQELLFLWTLLPLLIYISEPITSPFWLFLKSSNLSIFYPILLSVAATASSFAQRFKRSLGRVSCQCAPKGHVHVKA